MMTKMSTEMMTTTMMKVAATFSHRSIVMLTFFIAILGDSGLDTPSFSADPHSAVVRPGSTVMLSCSAKPEPAVTLRWMLNGTLVASQKSRGVEVRDGVIQILSFNRPEDVVHDGVYQCLASTPRGSVVSREARLEMAALGPFDGIRALKELNVIEGNVAVVPCSPPFSRPKAVIEFEHNGTRIPFSSRHVILPSGNLQIPNVSRSDDGIFQCTAYNPVTGSRIRSPISHRLQVQNVTGRLIPPTFSSTSPESVTVSQGSDLTLECAAEGFPAPDVSWEKYGGRLPVGRFTHVLGNLVIVGVQKFDSGTYLCRANNGIGTPPTKVISVDVLEAPSIEVGPAPQVAAETSTVTFRCRANGSPKVTVQWIFNGVPLVNGPTVAVRDASLTLTNIQRRQSGMYQCMARNSLGMTSAAASLEVTGIPGAPGGVPGSPGGGGAPGAQNGVTATETLSPTLLEETDNMYDYDYDDDDDDDDSDLDNGRLPGKSASGIFGEEGRKLPKGEAAKHELASPSKPEISRLSANSVLVKWMMPAAAQPTVPSGPSGPSVRMFKIQFKEVSDDGEDRKSPADWIFVEDDISYALRIFEVPDLTSGSTYRFRVIAVYSNQEMKRSPISVKFTLQDGQLQSIPVAAPKIVEARPLSTSEMFIGWQQQELDSGELWGFHIFYAPFGEDYTVRKMVIPGSRVRHAVLSHLQPGTSYSIRMKSYTEALSESGFSNTVVKNTLAYSNEPLSEDGQLSAIRPLLTNTNNKASPAEEKNRIGSRNPPSSAEEEDDGGDASSAAEGGVRRDIRDDGQLSLVVMVIAGVVVVVVVVIFAFCFVCIWKRRQKQATCVASEKKSKKHPSVESIESPELLRSLAVHADDNPTASAANRCQIKVNKYIYKVPTTHAPGCDGRCLSSASLGHYDVCQSSQKTRGEMTSSEEGAADLEKNHLLSSSIVQPQPNAFGSHSAKSSCEMQKEFDKMQISKTAAAAGSQLSWFPQMLASAVPLPQASDQNAGRRAEGAEGLVPLCDSHLPPSHPRAHLLFGPPLADDADSLLRNQELAPPAGGFRQHGAVATEPAYKTVQDIRRDKELRRLFKAYDGSDCSVIAPRYSPNSLSVGLSTLSNNLDSCDGSSADESPGQPLPRPSAFTRFSQPGAEEGGEAAFRDCRKVSAASPKYVNLDDVRSGSWMQLASQISDGSYNVRPANHRVMTQGTTCQQMV